MKRQVIEGVLFNEMIIYAEDRDLAIRLFKEKKACFAYRTMPVFILYKHSESIMSESNVQRNKKLYETHIKLFIEYLSKYVDSDEERSLLRKLIARTMLEHSYQDRLEGSLNESLRIALKSASYEVSFPFFRETFKILIKMLLKISESNTSS
jgi:hypothetical protein